jgi:hypothetical protein
VLLVATLHKLTATLGVQTAGREADALPPSPVEVQVVETSIFPSLPQSVTLPTPLQLDMDERLPLPVEQEQLCLVCPSGRLDEVDDDRERESHGVKTLCAIAA